MKIEFDSSNNHWVVTDKKGIKYYFGKSTGSRLVNVSVPSQIFKWHLDYVEDMFGNFMLLNYTYDGSRNAVFLNSIDY
jgi:hypothetical protein